LSNGDVTVRQQSSVDCATTRTEEVLPERLVANPHSASTWVASPQETVIRGGTSDNYNILYNDIHAAYQNAMRWKITGDGVHGNTARDILNAWSAELKQISGTSDRFLAAGIYGYQFANVGELMRDYPGFDLARFQRMMLEVFYHLPFASGKTMCSRCFAESMFLPSQQLGKSWMRLTFGPAGRSGTC
jgi:hypothetical protein